MRPPYVVNIDSLPGEPRPRYTSTPGVAAIVRLPSAVTGLTRMGVHVRRIEPGFAGTNRHFHTAEEEWVYKLGALAEWSIARRLKRGRPRGPLGFESLTLLHHQRPNKIYREDKQAVAVACIPEIEISTDPARIDLEVVINF